MTYGNYPDLSRVKRIIIIKLRHLGDVLLTTPVFTALREDCPQAKIDAYIYEEAVPILEGHPNIQEILTYNRAWKKLSFFQKIKKEIQILWKIRKNRYDLVINLTEGDRGDIVTRFSRASIRVGYEHDHQGFFKRKKIYTHLVKVCGPPRHMVERNLDAVRRIGIFPKVLDRKLFFSIPKSSIEDIKSRLEKEGFEKFILIHPSSRWRFKCWSIAKMRRLVEALLIQGEKVVLTSGQDDFEKQMIQEILQGLNPKLVLNLSGQVSLKELGALISIADLLICVDSLPLHLASAIRTPVVVLFGPTSDITWGPWMHPKAKVISQRLSCQPCFMDGCGGSKVSDCLETIPLQKVLQACEDIRSRDPQGFSVKT